MAENNKGLSYNAEARADVNATKDPEWSTAFGISSSYEDPYAAHSVKIGQDVNNHMNSAGGHLDSAGEHFKNAGDATQWNNLGDATGKAFEKYFKEKLERIKRSITKTKKISVGTLTKDIAPRCFKWENVPEIISQVSMDIVGKLLGFQNAENWGDMGGEALAELLALLKNDPGFNTALSSMDATKGIVDTMAFVNDIMKIVKDVWGFLEPAIPWVKIAANLATAFASGGATVPEATNEMAVQSNKALLQVTSMATKGFRKWLFSIKIELPAIIVDTYDSLMTNTAKKGWNEINGGQWVQAVIDDDFYRDTIRDLKYNYEGPNALSVLDNDIPSWIDKIERYTENPIKMAAMDSNNAILNSNSFKSSFTQYYMSSVVSIAENAIYVPPQWANPLNTTKDKKPSEVDGKNPSDKSTPPPPNSTKSLGRNYNKTTPSSYSLDKPMDKEDVQNCRNIGGSPLDIIESSGEIYNANKENT